MSRKRRRRPEPDDEPAIDPDDWVECGGELYSPAGFTAWGFPYGVRLDEDQAELEESERHKGWARAKQLLRRALSHPGRDERWVGRVQKVGEGLSRDIYAAEVEGGERLVVQLPRAQAPAGLAARTRREARLLAELATRQTGFRVPRPVAVLPTRDGPAMVREFLPGIPADLRAGRMPSMRPWELVAEIAAAIHALGTGDLKWSGGHATRRAHGEERLRALAATEDEEEPVRAARSWLEGHLPPKAPASLLHGDLLGQNLLLLPEEPLGVIDWEYAQLGDPAYDLAIVTRGTRRPFQLADGFVKLLDAYNRRAVHPVRACEVRFHEICLLVSWAQKASRATVRQQYLNRLRAVLDTSEREERATS